MLYDSLIKLTCLKRPTKWYDIDTRIYNRIVLRDVKEELKYYEYFNLFPSMDSYYKLLDFLLGVHALDRLVPYKKLKMDIWKSDSMLYKKLLGEDVDTLFSAEIYDPKYVKSIVINVDREARTIEIKYEEKDGKFNDIFRIESMGSELMFNKYKKSRTAAIRSIEKRMREYIDEAIRILYRSYT